MREHEIISRELDHVLAAFVRTSVEDAVPYIACAAMLKLWLRLEDSAFEGNTVEVAQAIKNVVEGTALAVLEKEKAEIEKFKKENPTCGIVLSKTCEWLLGVCTNDRPPFNLLQTLKNIRQSQGKAGEVEARLDAQRARRGLRH